MNAIRVTTLTSLRRLPTNGALRTPIWRTATRPKSAFATTAGAAATATASYRSPSNVALGIGGGLLLAGVHSATGSANDFYDYRFKSPKHPDDLASFYGGEELMELFCVFPIVGKIMMRNARFDETGNVITTGFPGRMKVSMVFSDEVNDNTGETDWFNKRERFRNSLFGYTCWDMVLNFGFRTLEDGTRECYHFGEYFHGNIPVVSQIMLLVFKAHARWVAWSTEHFINNFAFVPNDDEEAEEMEERSRANMPLFLLKNYAWSDLMAMLCGYDKDKTEKQPSFLIIDKDGSEKEGDEVNEVDKLPFQQKAIQQQISEDIKSDKEVMKELLGEQTTARSAGDVKAILVRRHTLNMQRRRATASNKEGAAGNNTEQQTVEGEQTSNDVYVIAKDLAVDRAMMRRLTRQKTRCAVESVVPKKDDEEGGQ